MTTRIVHRGKVKLRISFYQTYFRGCISWSTGALSRPRCVMEEDRIDRVSSTLLHPCRCLTGQSQELGASSCLTCPNGAREASPAIASRHISFPSIPVPVLPHRHVASHRRRSPSVAVVTATFQIRKGCVIWLTHGWQEPRCYRPQSMKRTKCFLRGP